MLGLVVSNMTRHTAGMVMAWLQRVHAASFGVSSFVAVCAVITPLLRDASAISAVVQRSRSSQLPKPDVDRFVGDVFVFGDVGFAQFAPMLCALGSSRKAFAEFLTPLLTAWRRFATCQRLADLVLGLFGMRSARIVSAGSFSDLPAVFFREDLDLGRFAHLPTAFCAHSAELMTAASTVRQTFRHAAKGILTRGWCQIAI
jgi:hypothetical protein